ncbi:MAG: PD-(D/E)XK nuclease family protein, partial [Crocinitomicaceae bacterium]|nr:PD-(D/E)XK nuclease family protein [Crocinitomicaceae bacterium]
GMVETRAIDFKNVFIVGANEDIFPGNLHSASLIPADIKRIYHLPDASQKESMYAHTFYRLLQRAEKVNLYYSSITSDFKGTEQSRFITQIELELSKMNPRISFRKHRVHIPDREKSNMHPGIENNEWSKNRLDKLFASGISPSAINCYNKCPMDFFYRYIIGIGEKEEMENHIDVSTFGSVVHHVLEKFFGKYIGNFPEEKELEDFKNHLQSYMDEAWEEHYSSARMDKGYNFLAATVAKEMLYKTINNEIEAQRSLKEQGKNIKIIAIEQPLKREVEGRKYGWDKPVSLRGKADRIDEVAGIIRILDYKTGKTEKKDVTWKNDDIFTYEKSKLLQLIAYVYMYCNEGQKPENVIAAIYSLKNFSEGLMILDPGSEPITEEKLFVFEEGLINWIKKVYDSPFFAHNPVSTYCEYCHRE